MRRLTIVGKLAVLTMYVCGGPDLTKNPEFLGYETMIFDTFAANQWKPLEFYQRYTSWDQASAGHGRVVEGVRAGETFSMEKLYLRRSNHDEKQPD